MRSGRTVWPDLAVALLGAWLGAALGAQEPGRFDEAVDGDREVPPAEVVSSWFPEEIARGLPGRVPGWLPVYLELETLRPGPQKIQVEAAVLSGGEPEFRVTRFVEVQPGAARRVWLYPRYEGRGRWSGAVTLRLRIRLSSGGTVFRELPASSIQLFDDLTLNSAIPAIECGEHVRPGSSGLLYTVGRRGLGTSNRVKALGVSETWLPDDPLGYHAVQALILRSFDESKLEKPQIEAIRNWVFLGGFVVLVPSSRGEIFDTRLARWLLPEGSIRKIEAEEDFVPGELVVVTDGERRLADPSAGDVPLESLPEPARPPAFLRVDPVRTATSREIRSVPPGASGGRAEFESAPRVYLEVPFGEGRVGILTIDDLAQGATPAKPAQTFRDALWRRILLATPDGTRGAWRREVASFEDGKLYERINDGLSSDLGLWFFAGLVIVYLVLIGPGLYFFLKRRNSLPWVVWLEPVVVIAYIGLIYLTGYLTRGVLTQTRVITVTRWRAGDPLLRRDAFLGIFSSEEARYRVATTGAPWLRPAFSNDMEWMPVHLVHDRQRGEARGPEIRDFRLDVWQTGVFAASAVEPIEGELTIELLEPGKDPPDGGGADEHRRYRIRNATTFSLAHGFLVGPRGGLFPLDGPLRPGGVLEVEMVAGQGISVSGRSRGRPGATAERPTPGENVLGGDRLLAETLLRFVSSAAGSRREDRLRLVGVLDRQDEDFVVDRSATLVHRADLLFYYDE